MRLLNKKPHKVIISITSLIDVVLLLLIFFMLTTSFVEQPGMKLDLPETTSSQQSEQEELVVTISVDNKLFLQDKEVTFENLGAELIKIKNAENYTGLVLKADEKVQHGIVVKVMDIAQSSGLSKLIIASKQAK